MKITRKSKFLYLEPRYFHHFFVALRKKDCNAVIYWKQSRKVLVFIPIWKKPRPCLGATRFGLRMTQLDAVEKPFLVEIDVLGKKKRFQTRNALRGDARSHPAARSLRLARP
jgi:hypothetical protein